MRTKEELLDLFHDSLMVFIDHLKEEAEFQTENIIITPASALETLLYEALSDYSDTVNENGSALTYGEILDNLSDEYRRL